MNQKPLFLAVALTALLVIGGAFWMMQKRQVAVNQPAVTDPVVETPVQTEPENPIDTSDWKTYRNEEYGFEVKYPKEWDEPHEFEVIGGNKRMLIGSGENFEGCCAGIRFELKEKPAKQAYSDKIETFLNGDLMNDEMRPLSETKVREIVYDTHYGNPERITFFPMGNLTLEIGREYKDSQAELVVSTFRVFTR